MNKRIEERLQQDYDRIASMGYDVVGVFLQGSQNYNLDYELSDIDTKVIVVPSVDNIIFNAPPVSSTILLENNEHIDYKDIRLMHECFRKQNINFLEILFTKYKKMNPVYADLYQPMFDNAEEIARYNEIAAVHCLYGTIAEKYKMIEHNRPGVSNQFELYGYDPKELHHLVRIDRFLTNYLNKLPYKDCLVDISQDFREYLIDIKRNPPLYNLEDARKVAKEIYDRRMEEKCKVISYLQPKINQTAYKIMNECMSGVIKKSWRDSLYER